MVKNNLPLVSILIPAYNRPHYLEIALTSALRQTYSNIEVIICDDSTDNRVYAMLVPYLAKYPQLKYFKNEKNLFLGNWHRCFDLASGEYINYLMDDDVFHREKIEKMMRYYLQSEDIALVSSFRQTIDLNGNFIPPILGTEKLFEETTILDGKHLGNYVLTKCMNVIGEPTTVLFRKRDLTEKFGVYKNKQYTHLNDLASWLSLLSKGKAVYISEALSYFRIHPNQNSSTLGSGYLPIREFLDLIIDSREDGFLHTVDLYKAALSRYQQVIPAPQTLSEKNKLIEDLKRIEFILKTI
ncbi:glycosyltransferase family 2 protein [Paenactinomyces guangxiensis]|uniref:Glycosyltransferase n=1 Tax=Paenactinomyces guangxiensis TaxID=1490290 RepID=A0A7W2A8M0_9BACL|nr:glycosyltransferase family 2 protein [Paenactinomyces guangxiensis]MBA4494329.1 glycosyltransferase [Paenactinomyces guangxiensis]MBH8590824.1 glycosyltransferase [Paenactinomyces guangxiensis]